jgi:hypothetical protein
MKHKYLLTLLVCAVTFMACKKETDSSEATQSTTTNGSASNEKSYFQFSPDTFYSPSVTKYALPTGSYVVKAVAKQNGPELLIYFKGKEPVSGSTYHLVESRNQPDLKDGEAFFRITSNSVTYFNDPVDSIIIVTKGNKKMLRSTGAKCSTEDNKDPRKTALYLTF